MPRRGDWGRGIPEYFICPDCNLLVPLPHVCPGPEPEQWEERA